MSLRLSHTTTPDGTRLAVGSFVAEEPGPAVLLVHGIASHMGWYRGLAEELLRGGVSTYLPDRRGVARSEGTTAHVANWRNLVEDALHVAREVERAHPAQPVHLMGISLGGLIALACAIRHPGFFRSIVLLSPALATSVQFPLPRRLTILSRALARPTTLIDLPFGVDRLTRSDAWRAALAGDRYRTQRVSARFLLEVLRLQRYVRRGARYVADPVLALFGADDEIIDGKTSIRVLDRIVGPVVRVEVFETVSHILVASLGRRQLADRLLAWLQGDEGSTHDRYSLIHTVLSHEGDDLGPPELG